MDEKMKDEITEVVERAVNNAMNLHAETHAAHHGWIQRKIDREDRRQRYFDDVMKYVIGTLVVAAVAAFIYWIGDAALTTARKILR